MTSLAINIDIFAIKRSQPQVTKNGGSIFIPSPTRPSIRFTTSIRRFFNESSVLPSGIETSLKQFSFVSVESL